MDQEQAERFFEAAQKGYAEAVSTFICFPDRQALRENVLAAQQVLELARTEIQKSVDIAFYSRGRGTGEDA